MEHKTIFRSPLVWALFAGIVVVAFLRSALPSAPEIPVVTEVPSFTLVSAEGEPFGSADLQGSVYVANFIFTRCVSLCPALMQSMAGLQERYRKAGLDDVRLVSFSVDPEADRPERLKEYARTHGADPARWTLLTGDVNDMRELVMEGFRVPMGERVELGDNLIDVAHSQKLVLVDRAGAVRGYFSSDEEGIEQLFRRTRQLARQRPS